MVMTSLRTQMKLILWILVFAFLATIVFSWGMGGFKTRDSDPGLLGVVGGFDMRADEFENVVRRKIDLAQSRGEESPQGDDLTKLREDTWDEQVDAILKFQEAKRLGIKVSDREIAYLVENNPPNEIRSVESFQTDGEFDPEKYRAFLRDPQATQFLLGLEESVRNYLIEQAVGFRATQSVTVPEQEIRDEFIAQFITGKLRFIFIPNDRIQKDTSLVTQDMKRRYYQLFKDRYQDFGMRQFAYVKFPLTPSKLDSADVRRTAQEILDELAMGGDFEALAKEFSQDESNADKGGDLGWFGKGSMVKPFEEAAFNAKPGDMLGPVESRFGLHIIKVEGKRVQDGEEEVSARHILLKLEATPDTRDEVYNEAYNFAQEVAERPFRTVAEEYDYEVDTTREFSQSGYIAGLGRMRMAAQFCFNNPVRTVSDVYPVPDGYVVFQITKATEDTYKPFEEVEGSITKALVDVMHRQQVWEEASRLLTDITTPEDMDRVAAAKGYEVYETSDSAKVGDALPGGLKRDNDFAKEAFRLDMGEVSGVIQTRNGCYIAYMEEKVPFDESGYLANHRIIFNNLNQQRAANLLRNWTRELRAAANIKDYRYRYFRDF